MDFLRNKTGVIFDLDGVITNTAEYHYFAWQKLANELGVRFTEADNERLKGVDRMASLEFILSLGGIQASQTQKLEMADRKNGYYKTLLMNLTEDDVLPGVKATLQYFKTNNLNVALASASLNAPAILGQLGLLDYFDHIADASLARSKPAPDVFLFAAYGIGCHAKECIAFEDAVAGLQAIQACSMMAVGVGETATLEPYADIVVPGLDVMFEWLDGADTPSVRH